MKVAILISRLSQGGGLEKYTHRLATAFTSSGCEVFILTTGETAGHSHPYQIISFGKPAKMSLLHLRHYDRHCNDWLSRNPVDIVFGMDRNSFQTHYRAGNGVHAEYLQKRKHTNGLLKRLSFWLNPLHRTILKLEKQTFESPQLRTLFTNSHMVKGEILRHYQTDPTKIQVVHNGVEWHEMETDFRDWQQKREALLKERHLSQHDKQLLFIGHGYRRKGLHLLLQALSAFRGEAVHLSILGKDKEVADFRKLASSLDISKQISFFGPRMDVRAFYQLADALVIPSLYDPFANVTVEALAMGVHVVSSKHNGGHEVLNPTNGTIIDNILDRKSIINALKNALERPKTLRQASTIRSSVRHLDFSTQLQSIVTKTLDVSSDITT